jgi:trans-aconitate methyltransferase
MVEDVWREFYTEREYDRCAYLEGEDMIAYAEALFDRIGVPETVGSVGCGPALVEFALAERYPETTFDCFDVAEQVVTDNAALARDRGLDNLSFERASLPALDIDREYDLVYCVATLYFVADVERAVGSLADHVSDGGYLVVSYPDSNLRAWVREQDDEKREFFSLVEAGENLLTREDIERLLDGDVWSYWSLRDDDVDRSATVYAKL